MRNWTIKDAVAVIQNGKDVEAIREIAKHFPEFFMAVARNDLGAVAAMMTDKMTVRRLQTMDEETEADDEVDEATEAEADSEGSDDADTDLDSMSTKQLIALCGKRGIKVPKYGKNKAFYLAALQGGSAEADDADGAAEEAEADPYAGKNALQLYSICKQRGLKLEPRQKAAVYLEALKKADAKAAKDEEVAEDEGDGWGDDDEEEAPKKSAKKAGSKGNTNKKAADKKAPAKAANASDDDDDWEL